MQDPRSDAPEPITVVDLFSGCGGFTQGFHEFRPSGAVAAGPVFHSLAAVENDAAAAATYSVNFGSRRPDESLPAAQVHFGDIELWHPTLEALHADVVVGGPPCQGFSALNRNKKGSERNRLWEEYVRIVARIRPKVFVIENVDRFLKSDEFRNLLREVREGGVLAEYRLVDPPGHAPTDTPETKIRRYLLNAADYGAPQARKRAVVIGVRCDMEVGRTMAYPLPTHVRPPKGHDDSADPPLVDVTGLAYWRPVGDVFEETDNREVKGTDLPDAKEHIAEINSVLPGIFTTDDLHFGRNPEPLSMARYMEIGRGGNRKDLQGKYYTVTEDGHIETFKSEPAGVVTTVRYLSTASWDNHTSGTGDVMGRLRRKRPSVTIRTEFFKPEKGRYLHPEDPRPITHYEAARIQGFPRTFRWCGSKTEIARQIGNAVPIPLGTAVAAAIHRFLRG